MLCGVVNPRASMACKRQGFMPPRLHHFISGSLCPMRARALAGDRELAVKLQVSRPTRDRAPGPSQGGSAGSNPVGATIHHQHNTAADQQERRSAAVLRVRPSPARSGCGRASVSMRVHVSVGVGVPERCLDMPADYWTHP